MRASKIIQAITYWPVLFLLKFFAHYRVYGIDNLSGLKYGPVIFAANHGSIADGPISGVALPFSFLPIRWLAYEGFYRWRFLFIAAYVRLNACIKIKSEPRGDLPVLLKDAVSALKKGDKIWIYPEGRRSHDGRTKRGKRGVAYLHEQTGAPVVPVGMWGNFNFFSWKTLMRRKFIRVRFGEPLYRLEGRDLKEQSNFVVRKISELRR